MIFSEGDQAGAAIAGIQARFGSPSPEEYEAARHNQ
jgi:hypothetical protein